MQEKPVVGVYNSDTKLIVQSSSFEAEISLEVVTVSGESSRNCSHDASTHSSASFNAPRLGSNKKDKKEEEEHQQLWKVPSYDDSFSQAPADEQQHHQLFQKQKRKDNNSNNKPEHCYSPQKVVIDSEAREVSNGSMQEDPTFAEHFSFNSTSWPSPFQQQQGPGTESLL